MGAIKGFVLVGVAWTLWGLLETIQTFTRMVGRSERPTCIWNQQMKWQDQKSEDAAADRNGKVQKQLSPELPEYSVKIQLEPRFIIFLNAATKHLRSVT